MGNGASIARSRVPLRSKQLPSIPDRLPDNLNTCIYPLRLQLIEESSKECLIPQKRFSGSSNKAYPIRQSRFSQRVMLSPSNSGDPEGRNVEDFIAKVTLKKQERERFQQENTPKNQRVCSFQKAKKFKKASSNGCHEFKNEKLLIGLKGQEQNEKSPQPRRKEKERVKTMMNLHQKVNPLESSKKLLPLEELTERNELESEQQSQQQQQYSPTKSSNFIKVSPLQRQVLRNKIKSIHSSFALHPLSTAFPGEESPILLPLDQKQGDENNKFFDFTSNSMTDAEICEQKQLRRFAESIQQLNLDKHKSLGEKSPNYGQVSPIESESLINTSFDQFSGPHRGQKRRTTFRSLVKSLPNTFLLIL